MGHAYYDFQHVELTNVGSGKKRQPYAGLSDLLADEPTIPIDSRPQSRTKNPPGGPSSNIFGAEEESPARPSGRPNKMASSLPFGDTVDSTPSSASSSPPPTPVKTAEVIPLPLHTGDLKPVSGPDLVLAEFLAPATRKAAPNPVTGQGYEPAEPAKKPSPQPTTPRRRIPPGGFSSPLW